MNSTKSCLLSGASGFIGRDKALALEGDGWKVTRGIRQADSDLKDGCLYLNLSDPTTIRSLLKTHCLDAIVHLGVQVVWSGATEAEMFVPNVLSTGCLSHLARHWNARLVFASAAILHGAKMERIESQSPVLLDTLYGRSKWLGEQLIVASHAKHCLLRIAGVFGLDGLAHLAINKAIWDAGKGESPTLVGYGGASRNYVYVNDVAQAIVYPLRVGLDGIHLLSGQEILSIADMLRAICDEFLPGMHPISKIGPESTDQIVQPSSELPVTRGFRQALSDIRKAGTEA